MCTDCLHPVLEAAAELHGRDEETECKSSAMTTAPDHIDTLIAKLRQLPPERQQLIADAIEEMSNEPYELSPEELAILRPALEDVKTGIECSDAETDDVLNKPWA